MVELAFDDPFPLPVELLDLKARNAGVTGVEYTVGRGAEGMR